MKDLKYYVDLIKEGYTYEVVFDSTGNFYLVVENPNYANPWDDQNLVVELVAKK